MCPLHPTGYTYAKADERLSVCLYKHDITLRIKFSLTVYQC